MIAVLKQSIQQLISQLPHVNKIVVAYSGGMDSHALLHALAHSENLAKTVHLSAVHINHQISVQAHDWAEHCESICRALAVAYSQQTINIAAQDPRGLEMAARDSRYHCLQSYSDKTSVVALAHHQDDQAETFLLQALRGAGVQGLSAMPFLKPFGLGHLWRPLLSCPRSEIARYAEQHHLQWIDDDSNFDISYRRNFLRHEIMPLLKHHWPSASSTLARASAHCQQATALLTTAAEQIFQAADQATDAPLSLQFLHDHTQAQQYHLLRHWLRAQQIRVPNQKKLIELQRMMASAKADTSPQVQWDNTIIRRYRDHLYCTSAMPTLTSDVMDWHNFPEPLTLPDDLGQLRCVWHDTSATIAGEWQVRFNQLSEHFVPVGHLHGKPLKKWLQQWGVPPWLRPMLPLIYHNNQLVMIAGGAASASFAAAHGNQLRGIAWRHYPRQFVAVQLGTIDKLSENSE